MTLLMSPLRDAYVNKIITDRYFSIPLDSIVSFNKTLDSILLYQILQKVSPRTPDDHHML